MSLAGVVLSGAAAHRSSSKAEQQLESRSQASACPAKSLARASGSPAADRIAADKELTLEVVDGRVLEKPPVFADPFALPAAPEPFDDGERVDVDVSREVDATGAASAATGTAADPSAVVRPDDEMPLLRTQDALAALDSVLLANADAETVKFLLDSAKAKLWRHAYVDST